jgi:hypothetical protein
MPGLSGGGEAPGVHMRIGTRSHARVNAVRSGEEAVSLSVGQHLWPELGHRLDHLLDYPYGCVEQTTEAEVHPEEGKRGARAGHPAEAGPARRPPRGA